MKKEYIVNSLLDTDFYKITMGQVFFLQHPDLCGEYDFKCRNKDVKFTTEMVEQIREEVAHLCTLRFTKEELDYLRTIPFLKESYITFLKYYQPDRDCVNIRLTDDGELKVMVHGALYEATWFEIYLLEIINEVYFRCKYNTRMLYDDAVKRLDLKVAEFKNGNYSFQFAEFGCRRRLSREFQVYAYTELLKTGRCVGTSNVRLAMDTKTTPIGTYAHELVQSYQGIPGLEPAYTNKVMMDEWFNLYNGNVGTALTDTLTTDIFLRDLDKKNAMLYTGFRHDSGDPIAWGEKIIKKLESFGIDSKTKTLLFSDSLDFDKAQKLHEHFIGRVKVSFGIGTFITNDTFAPALNIVLKLQSVNGRNVAKLSDNPEKAMCRSAEYLDYLRRCVDYRLSLKED